MKQINLKRRPKGMPEDQDFEIKNVMLPKLNDGEVHVKLIYLSVDPYLRGRMNDTKSYVPPFNLDEPIESTGICQVVDSKTASFKTGDIVMGTIPWQEEMVVEATKLNKIDPSLVSPSAYLGIIGLTGLTAYFGLLDIGELKKGETVVVSAGAGAVGSAVGQIARIRGAYVVGIAGSEEKVRYMTNELGFDAGVNYRSPLYQEQLAKACPKGVDVYFENVGGQVSDKVWPLLNKFARIPVCGAISSYNKSPEEDSGPRVQSYLIKSSAKMQGFVVGNYANRFQEGREQLIKWLKEGNLKNKETTVEGFDKIIPAFLSLFKGHNLGKIVVKMGDE